MSSTRKSGRHRGGAQAFRFAGADHDHRCGPQTRGCRSSRLVTPGVICVLLIDQIAAGDPPRVSLTLRDDWRRSRGGRSSTVRTTPKSAVADRCRRHREDRDGGKPPLAPAQPPRVTRPAAAPPPGRRRHPAAARIAGGRPSRGRSASACDRHVAICSSTRLSASADRGPRLSPFVQRARMLPSSSTTSASGGRRRSSVRSDGGCQSMASASGVTDAGDVIEGARTIPDAR